MGSLVPEVKVLKPNDLVYSLMLMDGYDLAPAAMAPCPLVWSLADPSLELLLHLGSDPFHVIGLIARARHFELLELDPEAALFAHAQAT